MDKISFIVDRLKMPPFNLRIATLAEFDSKQSIELLDILCDIIVAIEPDQIDIKKETIENRIAIIIQFLLLMKYQIPGDPGHFQDLMLQGDKDILHGVVHWLLSKFEHLQKRAYLSKYLLPVDVSPDFAGDPLIIELSQRLKDMQVEFKNVHKAADQQRATGVKPNDLKAEIAQLEQEKTQLTQKINRLKKDVKGDEPYFQNMLKVSKLIIIFASDLA